MSFTMPDSAIGFLKELLGDIPHAADLVDYEAWWRAEGQSISAATDRAGTPWLRMFDRLGARVDEVLFAPEYWHMLKQGYRAGAVWPVFEEGSLRFAYQVGYVTAFFDPGLYCPYIISLATAVSVAKYGTPDVQARFLPALVRRADPWQGATWFTEAGGGSDLGATVETAARPSGDHWLLTGDKYFSSNAHADIAVVAARAAEGRGGARSVRDLALFLVPRRREDGGLNYFIRRLKDKIATRSVPTGEIELRDSEGYLLGRAEQGIYLILEVLNFSRAANSIGAVALAQRALYDAYTFAQERVAFGRPILDQPLMRAQFEERLLTVRRAGALAWDALHLLDEVWRETAPYSARYHLFRLVVHLAKYWTAEVAAQTAKWAMEVQGGMGTLAEYPAERWLREAMILAIWEGPQHRQILDGLEAIERKGAHETLFRHLADVMPEESLAEMSARITAHLALAPEEREARAEGLFRDLAMFTADGALRRRERQHAGA